MLFLTWNVDEREAAWRLVVEYLAQLNESFLAVIQELPPLVNSTSKAELTLRNLTGTRARCLGVGGSTRAQGRVGMFSSSDVVPDGRFTMDETCRLLMARVKLADGAPLHAVGVHGLDRINYSNDFDRGSWARDARRALDSFRTRAIPLAVIGDFNSEPYDREVSGSKGLSALRDRSDMKQAKRSGEPLYNPMWELLPEVRNSDRAQGSLRLKSRRWGVRWRLCDQILVSRDLIPSLDGSPEILRRLGTTTLVDDQGRPDKLNMSDHLPVQLRVKLEGT